MYKIWDKKSDINGVSLNTILGYRKDLKNAIENNVGVFLKFNNNQVESFEFEDDIIRLYGLDASLTTDVIFSLYVKIKEEEIKQQKDEDISLENKISILKKQNANLLLQMAKIEVRLNQK